MAAKHCGELIRTCFLPSTFTLNFLFGFTCLGWWLVTAREANTSTAGEAFVSGHSLCDFQESVTSGSSSAAAWAETTRPLVCARWCQDDNRCQGFSYPIYSQGGNDSSSRETARTLPSYHGVGKVPCFFHWRIKSAQFCTKQEVNFSLYVKPDVCYNGGKRNDLEDRCDCSGTNFLAGTKCADYPKDCRELFTSGFRSVKTEVYLQPSRGGEKLLTHCLVYPKGYCETDVALNTLDVYPDFNRSWHDYEKGFRGDGFFWIGLKNLRSILETSEVRTILRISLEIQHKVFGHQDYVDFRIGDQSSGYVMTYSRVDGVGNVKALKSRACFKSSFGRAFSTYDREGNADPHRKCASLSGAGGWFGECPSACNLLGGFPGQQDSDNFTAVSFPGLSTDTLAQNLSRIHIKIRHMRY